MTIGTKLLIFLFFVLALGSGSFILYKHLELEVREKAIETNLTKQKELADGITRALTEYATKKDIEKFAQDNHIDLTPIQEDLKKVKADIIVIGHNQVLSMGKQADNLPSTTVDINKNNIPVLEDKYNYFKNKQNFVLDEKFSNISVPIGEVSFSAWQENPWSIDQPTRTYNLDTVIATNEDNKHFVYNKLSINVNNKNYPISINKTDYKELYPESKFNFWSPRLYLSFDVGMNVSASTAEFIPGLNFQIMSYGKFNNSPDFSILQLGLGYGIVGKNLNFTFTPISYNIAKHIPLIDNLFLGPSIGYSTTGDISVMMGVKAAL